MAAYVRSIPSRSAVVVPVPGSVDEPVPDVEPNIQQNPQGWFQYNLRRLGNTAANRQALSWQMRQAGVGFVDSTGKWYGTTGRGGGTEYHTELKERVQREKVERQRQYEIQNKQDIDAAVDAEVQRIETKYSNRGVYRLDAPPYFVSETGRENIRRNILLYGSPISPMRRTNPRDPYYEKPPEPVTYPSYSREAARAQMEKEIDYRQSRYNVFRNPQGESGITSYPYAKYLISRNTVDFGGVMGGELKPGSAIDQGFENMFSRRRQRYIATENIPSYQVDASTPFEPVKPEEDRATPPAEAQAFDIPEQFNSFFAAAEFVGLKPPEGVEVSRPEQRQIVEMSILPGIEFGRLFSGKPEAPEGYEVDVPQGTGWSVYAPGTVPFVSRQSAETYSTQPDVLGTAATAAVIFGSGLLKAGEVSKNSGWLKTLAFGKEVFKTGASLKIGYEMIGGYVSQNIINPIVGQAYYDIGRGADKLGPYAGTFVKAAVLSPGGAGMFYGMRAVGYLAPYTGLVSKKEGGAVAMFVRQSPQTYFSPQGSAADFTRFMLGEGARLYAGGIVYGGIGVLGRRIANFKLPTNIKGKIIYQAQNFKFKNPFKIPPEEYIKRPSMRVGNWEVTAQVGNQIRRTGFAKKMPGTQLSRFGGKKIFTNWKPTYNYARADATPWSVQERMKRGRYQRVSYGWRRLPKNMRAASAAETPYNVPEDFPTQSRVSGAGVNIPQSVIRQPQAIKSFQMGFRGSARFSSNSFRTQFNTAMFKPQVGGLKEISRLGNIKSNLQISSQLSANRLGNVNVFQTMYRASSFNANQFGNRNMASYKYEYKYEYKTPYVPPYVPKLRLPTFGAGSRNGGRGRWRFSFGRFNPLAKLSLFGSPSKKKKRRRRIKHGRA